MDVQKILDDIRRKIILHQTFEMAYKRFSSAVKFADEGTAVVLVGPTRVGKTTLLNRLINDLVKPDPTGATIAAILIEAAATDCGFISTKYLKEQCLIALKHPFHTGEGTQARLSWSEARLTNRLELAMIHRGTRYLIVDEGHHLVRTKSTRSAVAAVDSLKCLCNKTRAVLVIVAGYEILGAALVSAHFNGRCQPLEFPCYRNDDADADDFERLLATIDSALPWRAGESMVKYSEFMHEGTCGCYGLLLQWTKAALSEMWSVGATRLTKAHYSATMFESLMIPIRDEIAVGDEYFSRRKNSTPRSYDKSSVPKRSTARKPFQRKPKRDRVGGEDHQT